jgi:hypothetical protein
MNVNSRLKDLRGHLKRGRERIRRILTRNRRRRRAIARLEKQLGPRLGVDFAWGRPDPQVLKDAGLTFVCRYYSHDGSKNLSLAEAQGYAKAGLDVVAVWESTANAAAAGHDQGRADAAAALTLAKACGQPDDAPIYFAIDFEATLAQVKGYFEGIATVLPLRRIGAYGGYGVEHELFDAGLIRYGWQTYAWSGGRWEPRAQLRQYSNDHVIDGVGVDYDQSTESYFGQWRPR